MPILRRSFPGLLAALLLVQWAAALLPCLRGLSLLASAQAIELCSPDGHFRTILVDAEGREVPSPKASHGGCPLCQQVEPALLPVPVAVSRARIAHAPALPELARPGLPPTPPRGPPQQPRAPPAA